MRIILATQLERVNYGLRKPKDDNEAFLIENLVMWECYVESPRCLAWAREQFDSWMKQDDLTNNPYVYYEPVRVFGEKKTVFKKASCDTYDM